jgi:hypothetical protein
MFFGKAASVSIVIVVSSGTTLSCVVVDGCYITVKAHRHQPPSKTVQTPNTIACQTH